MDRDQRRIEALVGWFQGSARDLPWRRRRSGYSALVAEAMLQQTQVARVVDSYRAFLRRFPTVRALAAADEQDVLAAWRGLGYYRRARNLHAAARAIERDFGGRVPRDAARLARLPGVGRYTAGAIASIVYGRAEAAVDGNVMRVLARWYAIDRPPDATVQRELWRRAAELAETAGDPGVLNEGLMELGAVICPPQKPRCSACPVARWCEARRQGREREIPPPRPAPRAKPVHHHAVVISRGRDVRDSRDAREVFLRQRGNSGLWAGMWQPPTIEAEGQLTPETLAARLAGEGVPVFGLVERGSFRYRTTHRRITFHVFEGRSRSRQGQWRGLGDLDDLPMSNAHRKAIELWMTG